MKYLNKCAYCGRCADDKWRGEYFCNDHKKFMRRKKIESFLGKERIAGAIPCSDFGDSRKVLNIYTDIPVYLK